MAPTATQAVRGVTRKKPPTFQHHPAQRAKKLKESWVETQKIKSKWKAQKRKEGLVVPRGQLERMADMAENKARESDEDQGDRASMSASSHPGEESESEGSEEASGDATFDSKMSSVAGEESPRIAHAAASAKMKRTKGSMDHKKIDKQPSLRGIQRDAYPRSTLHPHKSDSRHHHKGDAASRGRGDRRTGRGGCGQRGRGKGGGQPDMGLRMKATLEKIKRDYS